MNKNMIFLAILLGFSLTTRAMEVGESSEIGTVAPLYKGEILSFKNLAKHAQMPVGVREVVNEWAYQNQELLHSLIPLEEKTAKTNKDALLQVISGVEALKQANIAIPLQKIESKLLGREIEFPGYSYIFKFPHTIGNKEYFVQIATPLHKIYNLEAYNGIGWGQELKEDSKITKTLQTTSRSWHYLQTKQAKEQYHSQFHVPATYIAQVPGRSDIQYGAFDENSFVIQEDRGSDWVTIRENKKLLSNVTEETLKQFYGIIKKGVLWDVNGNGLINEKTYSLGQSDFEQPNDQNPELFGYTYPLNKELLAWNADGKKAATFKLQHSITCGLGGSALLFKEALAEGHDVADQCKVFKTLVENDEELNQFPEGLAKQIKVAAVFDLQ